MLPRPHSTTIRRPAVSDGFANCAEAKAAGRGTITRNDPAYKPSLDSDGDGLACERSEVSGASLAVTGSSSSSLAVWWSVLLIAAGALFVQIGRVKDERRHAEG